MAVYFVGDIQGCYSELSALLDKVAFSSTDDLLYVAGDLVARGSDSLSTLRLLKSLKNQAKIVLGNHDLHLLAIHSGLKRAKPQDKLASLLTAPDLDELMDWLVHQPLIQKLPDEATYMTHAGLSPQWTPELALIHAENAHQKLISDQKYYWLENMYGEQPNFYSPDHNELMLFRFTINSLTRMRYCYANGSLDFQCKENINEAPKNLLAWYEFDHIKQDVNWIFGHWAALMGNCSKSNIYALDTGCVWGQHLTMLRWHDKKLITEPAHKN